MPPSLDLSKHIFLFSRGDASFPGKMSRRSTREISRAGKGGRDPIGSRRIRSGSH